ncbi:MAG: DNA primase [Gammaproteobacteria bacterium]
MEGSTLRRCLLQKSCYLSDREKQHNHSSFEDIRMHAISEDIIDRVKQVPIETIASHHGIEIKQAGKYLKALCPFHEERHPSFTISPTENMFKCYSCEAWGDVIAFERQIIGKDCSFPAATRSVASIAGIPIPEQVQCVDYELYGVLREATDFYAGKLKSLTERQRRYLRERAITQQIAATFCLGLAPGAGGLLDTLRKAHLLKTLDDAGLIKAHQGRYRDRFYDRLMFPVRDINGRTVSLAGRIWPGSTHPAKYLNGPKTVCFVKGQHLYGLYEASQKWCGKKLSKLVIVEGYMDVITGQGLDLPCVGTMGTSPTIRQIALAYRYVDELVFWFDGDTAGQDANWRALERCIPHLRQGKRAKFMPVVDGDPDSWLRANGKKGFCRLYQEEAYELGGIFSSNGTIEQREARTLTRPT